MFTRARGGPPCAPAPPGWGSRRGGPPPRAPGGRVGGGSPHPPSPCRNSTSAGFKSSGTSQWGLCPTPGKRTTRPLGKASAAARASSGNRGPSSSPPDDQRRSLDLRPVVDHGGGANHLAVEGADGGKPRPLPGEPPPVVDADVLQIPIVPPRHMPSNGGECGGVAPVRGGGDRNPSSPGTGVGKPDGVHQRHMGGPLRIEEGEAARLHPAIGVPHHRGPFHLQVIQHPGDVPGVHVQRIGDEGLGRPPVPDLVHGHHPEPRRHQVVDGSLPRGGPVVPPVEEDHHPVIALPRGADIHVRHPHRLAVQRELHEGHRVGVRHILQVDRDGPPALGRPIRRLLGGEPLRRHEDEGHKSRRSSKREDGKPVATRSVGAVHHG